MQGTVWAGLICPCTMDKLGRQAYGDKSLLDKYRGEVEMFPLQMVDDVILASLSSNEVIRSNAAVNSFAKFKKKVASNT